MRNYKKELNVFRKCGNKLNTENTRSETKTSRKQD